MYLLDGPSGMAGGGGERVAKNGSKRKAFTCVLYK